MPENDLFESFTTMTQTDLHPLPASEVRRRGDRLRRRNTALAVAGGTVAAMTAIGVPVALSQDGTDARPDPGLYATDGPSTDAVAWRVDVPEDFPLTEGMPETNVLSGTPVEARPGYEPQAPGPCAGPAWDVTGALDSLQAVFQDTEGGVDRTVSVFPDDEAARDRVRTFEDQVRTCSDPRVRADVLGGTDGESDQALVFVNAWDDDTGYLHRVVRVGNAVLYSTTSFNGAGDPAVVAETASRTDADSQTVVDAMCTFAADPC